MELIKNSIMALRAFWGARQDNAGVEVTGETIGWLIAVIVLVLVAVGFANGSGTSWMNHMFNNITQIAP